MRFVENMKRKGGFARRCKLIVSLRFYLGTDLNAPVTRASEQFPRLQSGFYRKFEAAKVGQPQNKAQRIKETNTESEILVAKGVGTQESEDQIVWGSGQDQTAENRSLSPTLFGFI
jgi:hypothetical protein